MIPKRLSSLSKTEEIFEKMKTPYEKILKNSGFKTPRHIIRTIFRKI